MKNRKYFESLAKQMENVDLTNILVSIDPEYDGKNLKEIAKTILENGDYIKLEKINAYIEKFNDETLDTSDEIKELEEKYQVAIDMAISDQEEANRRRVAYIEKYDDYNKQSEIENIEQDANDEISARLFEVNQELEKLNKKEMLLDGELSRRMLRRKTELESEKSILENKKVDIEDSKREAYYLAKEEEKNIKKAQDTRNELIKELSGKKVELYRKLGEFRKLRKEYLYISNEIFKAIVEEKHKDDDQYEEVKTKFEELIVSGDLDLIKEYLPAYKEALAAKLKSDEKINNLFRDEEISREPIEEENTEDTIETKEESVEETIDVPEVEESVEETIDVPEVEESVEETIDVPETEETIENLDDKEDTIYSKAKIKGIEDGTAAAATEYETQYTGIAEDMPIKESLELPSEDSTDYNEIYNYFYNNSWNKFRESIFDSEMKDIKEVEALEGELTEKPVVSNEKIEPTIEEPAEIPAVEELTETVETPAEEVSEESLEETTELPIEKITEETSEEPVYNPFEIGDDSKVESVTDDEFVDNLSDETNISNTEGEFVDSADDEKLEDIGNLEEYGFEPNPINKVIEPQTEELVDMNEVMQEVKDETSSEIVTEETPENSEVEETTPTLEQIKHKKGLLKKFFGDKDNSKNVVLSNESDQTYVEEEKTKTR